MLPSRIWFSHLVSFKLKPPLSNLSSIFLFSSLGSQSSGRRCIGTGCTVHGSLCDHCLCGLAWPVTVLDNLVWILHKQNLKIVMEMIVYLIINFRKKKGEIWLRHVSLSSKRYFKMFKMYLCGESCVCQSICLGVRGHLIGVGSFLPPCED